MKTLGICLFFILPARIALSQAALTPGAVGAGALEGVKADYTQKVLPILSQCCFACHGPQAQDVDHVTDPSVQKKITKLIKRAKYQFPMFETFPFPDDDDPLDSLKHLVKSLKKNSMPPTKAQKLFHLGRPLNPQEKKIILDWARKSLKQMKAL